MDTTTMTKAKILDDLYSARAEWDALMLEIGEERMTEAGACGYWSVKDVMAHLTNYTRWFRNAAQAHVRGEPLPMDGTEMMALEDKNQTYYNKTKHLSLAETQADSKEVFDSLMAILETQPEEFFTEPILFLGAPAPIIVWQPLRSEISKHTRDHIGWLREWLAAK
jgi:hypothetical protein